jgi:Zn-dependent M16 (insulinase) family peptidase
VEECEVAVKWLKLITCHTQFDKSQIKIVISNLLKEIRKRKQQPFDLIHSMSNDVYFKEESNLCTNNFLRQETFLSKLLQELNDYKEEDDKKTNVELKLEELRGQLLADGDNLRFYFCTDLKRLYSLRPNMDKVWLDQFPADLSFNGQNLFHRPQAQPFSVVKTSHLKKIANKPGEFLKTPEPKKDMLVTLGSNESSYLRIMSSVDINNYQHPMYASLLVLIEYFTQSEGPLFEAVRGPGYCYHQSIHLSLDRACIELILEECSNLPKAYEATRKTFVIY